MKDHLNPGRRVRLGVLASGGGTNLQAIMDRVRGGSLRAEVGVVISNNSQAGALGRARALQVPALHISSRQFPDTADLDEAILRALREQGVELIALAGYMKRLGPRVLGAYPNRILNIHPALLPAFGGEGMYGMRVHEAVVASGVKLTGVTVHLVDEVYDHGPIVAQRAVPVEDDDTPESLFERVLKVEHALYPEVLQWFAEGRVRVEGRRVYILKKMNDER
jgi:phosphoribosylglycinamide formyltransferase-1